MTSAGPVWEQRGASVGRGLPAHCGGWVVDVEASAVRRGSAPMFVYLLGPRLPVESERNSHLLIVSAPL